VDNRFIDGGKVVSFTHRPLFTPQEDSWYSFLLEAESTPGLYKAGRIRPIENIQLFHKDPILRPSGFWHIPSTNRVIARHTNMTAGGKAAVVSCSSYLTLRLYIF
jgi:hypothetical protein